MPVTAAGTGESVAADDPYAIGHSIFTSIQFDAISLPAPVTELAQGHDVKALFMTVWCPDSRSVESNCGIPRG